MSVSLAVILIVIIIITSLLITRQKTSAPRRPISGKIVWSTAPTAAAASPAAAVNKLVESGLRGNGVPLHPVIPLEWHNATGTYNLVLVVGSNTVHAAFDTGSAQFVVTTTDCNTCTAPAYNPIKSTSAFAIMDHTRDSLCTSSITYVSQTNTLQMYSDTVTIPRKLAPDCLGRPVSDDTKVAPIVIPDFPVGGVVHNTGQSSVNVFGISGVMTSARSSDKKHLTPSCQIVDTPIFESPVLQAVHTYSKKLDKPMVLSVRFAPKREDGGSVMFMENSSVCDTPVFYTPMVEKLPSAPSDLANTPYRYYVIEVESASTYHDKLPLPEFPKYLIIDTATTQFMVPKQVSVPKLLNGGLVVTVAHTGGKTLSWSLSPEDEHYGVPMFVSMPDAVAFEFSSKKDVGILGAMAMRGRYFEFTYDTPRRIGFG